MYVRRLREVGMSVTRGDIIHMKSFRHSQPGLEVTYKANPDKVAVFLLLGHAPRKEPELFDPSQALNMLGWVANVGAVEHATQLLDSCKEMLNMLEQMSLPAGFALDRARAVIAKATGAA